jgi:hypothetical protein
MAIYDMAVNEYKKVYYCKRCNLTKEIDYVKTSFGLLKIHEVIR